MAFFKGQEISSMSDRKVGTNKEKNRVNQPQQEDVSLESSGDVIIVPKKSLPMPPKDKRIHPRRPLPQIPETSSKGKEGDKQKH